LQGLATCAAREAGTLKAQIGRVFEIDEIVQAHRLTEEHKTGSKIVVLVP
jgi:NADPH:quinone reductase-like Zn-dependent oxidoreductase